ncbi:MAG: FAD-dependent oxidoreductase, partial [Dermatophilaceae bacterium]
ARASLWWSRRGGAAPVAPAPSGVLPPTADVLVVGGGLTGLCTAVLLGRAGLRPVLVEARALGAGTTGHSTAKLSLLQGEVYSRMRKHAGDEVLSAYVAGSRVGQQWLVELARSRGVDVTERDAFTYAVDEQGARTVEEEADAARTAGLTVTDDGGDLPFPVRRGIRLASQFQVDPLDLVDALRAELDALGATVVEGVRVTGASLRPPYRVETTAGDIRAGHVVLATQTPIFDRTAHFARLRAQRSYALAYRVPDDVPVPESMSLSVGSLSRSLRTSDDRDGGRLLLVGGEGHEVGRASSPAEHEHRLDAWTHEWFPGAEQVASWSAQDYSPVRGYPYIGAVPATDGRLLVATGYAKWGMTGAPAAAHLLTGLITRQVPGWAEPLLRERPVPRSLVEALTHNASVGAHLVGDRVRTVRPSADRPPAEGTGRVEGGPLGPTAVSTVEGRTCRVSAVCPHLGGVLAWNDAEKSWDCPLHGSRFAADGQVLEGPATTGLTARDD